MLFIVSVKVVLYSVGSGVKSVDDDLSGFSMSSLSDVHLYSVSRYGCMVCWAVSILGWDVIVFMSSAYASSWTLVGGFSMSEV